MKIGDKVCACISSSATRQHGNIITEEETVKRTGTIVYIHPRGRFYTVEFAFPAGTVRECYV